MIAIIIILSFLLMFFTLTPKHIRIKEYDYINPKPKFPPPRQPYKRKYK